MSKTSCTSRREAVSLLVACLLTSPAVSATASDVSIEHHSNGSRLLESVFKHWESARQIGRAYRMAYPSDCNPEGWLGEIVGTDLATAGREPEIDSYSVRRSIARNIQSDFENDDVVLLDGWVLSRTEARMCVATYLL